MLLDALQIDVIGELRVEAGDIELDGLGVFAKRLRLEVLLVFEQAVVHLPELALRACGFGRFGGQLGVRMRSDDRKMTEAESDPALEMLEHDLDAVIGLRTDRALEIAVFDDDHACVGSAQDMVDGHE
jgi:hypothetical protein